MIHDTVRGSRVCPRLVHLVVRVRLLTHWVERRRILRGRWDGAIEDGLYGRMKEQTVRSIATGREVPDNGENFDK